MIEVFAYLVILIVLAVIELIYNAAIYAIAGVLMAIVIGSIGISELIKRRKAKAAQAEPGTKTSYTGLIVLFAGLAILIIVAIVSNNKNDNNSSSASDRVEEKYETCQAYEDGYVYLSEKYGTVRRDDKRQVLTIELNDYLASGVFSLLDYRYKEEKLDGCIIATAQLNEKECEEISDRFVEICTKELGPDFQYSLSDDGIGSYDWIFSDKKIFILTSDDSVHCLMYVDDFEWVETFLASLEG